MLIFSLHFLIWSDGVVVKTLDCGDIYDGSILPSDNIFYFFTKYYYIHFIQTTEIITTTAIIVYNNIIN